MASYQQADIIIDLLKQLVAASRSRVAVADSISLDAALLIDDYFAQHHVGGRTQRLAKIQSAVKRAIERATEAS